MRRPSLPPDQIQHVDLAAEALGRSPSGADLADLTPHDPKSTARFSSIIYNTRREFVWGLDYIDELLAVIWTGPLGDVYDHVLQDANYNVVAHAYANATPATGVRHQFRYHPYGQWTYENAGGGETVTTNINSRLHATHGWQGLWFDQESGLIYIRGRYYDPISGRFLSRDPNGQALTLTTALRSNAQTPAAFVGVWPQEQYGDGLNPYLPYSANPISRRDPAGLLSLMDLGTTMGIQGGAGGFIGGFVSRFAGGSFWEGFASGAIGGALGGGAGYAFAASRAGFIGSAVLGRMAEGFAEEAGTSYYNSQDLKAAVVDGLFGSVSSAATGGLFSLGKREIGALAAVDGAGKFTGTARRWATRPAIGPGSFRDDLAKYWSMRAPEGYHAHHVFPLEHAPKFRAAGVEPEDVRFGTWWEIADHVGKAKEYTAKWDKFFVNSPNATFEQILEEGRRLSSEYGVKTAF